MTKDATLKLVRQIRKLGSKEVERAIRFLQQGPPGKPEVEDISFDRLIQSGKFDQFCRDHGQDPDMMNYWLCREFPDKLMQAFADVKLIDRYVKGQQ
jgi:hypothetical protein